MYVLFFKQFQHLADLLANIYLQIYIFILYIYIINYNIYLYNHIFIYYIRSDQISCSVVSDSVRPQRRQPTRLLHPWDSPGKNTGVGCHFLLQCMKVESESEVTQSCLTLSDPMDCSPPGSSVHGIFQARVLEWGAIAFSQIILYACI